jgi:hypothetical protein
MNRRSFFKFLPIAPVALVAEGARAASLIDAPHEGEYSIAITGSLKNKCQTTLGIGSISYNYPITDPNKMVSMSVGQDGNLWLKSKNGEWKKVMTDG